MTKALVRNLPVSIRAKAHWDAVPRPHYLQGALAGADQAREQGVTEISVIEFGVAGGAGLVQLQAMAEAVEKQTGIRIFVFGFDTGSGLPRSLGDYRDHPDKWRPGDYPMHEPLLRGKLGPRSSLLLGDIGDTVPEFVRQSHPPVGFIAMDVDFYSSTQKALQILVLPGSRMLHRVPIYLDDVVFIHNHRFAGELLAIDEFNEQNQRVKIDRWHGLEDDRPFPENGWIRQMYVAHDLEAIGRAALSREVRHLVLA